MEKLGRLCVTQAGIISCYSSRLELFERPDSTPSVVCRTVKGLMTFKPGLNSTVMNELQSYEFNIAGTL